MEICKKIDVHAHVVLNREYEYVDDHCVMVTPEELLEVYDKIGVDRGILQPLISPEAHNMAYSNGNRLLPHISIPTVFSGFAVFIPRDCGTVRIRIFRI